MGGFEHVVIVEVDECLEKLVGLKTLIGYVKPESLVGVALK